MLEQRPRSRVSAAVLLGGCILVGACAGTPLATVGPPAPTPTAAPATATERLPTPIPTPTRKPLATFSATVEPATEAPEGGISLELHHVDTTPQFNPDAITATAGTVVLYLANTDKVSVRHDFNIGPEVGVSQARMPSIGGSTAVTLTLADVPAGTYAFWCSIQDHFKYGMVGTLVVTP